jgi:ribosome-binding protein aMBF1 (putative translation factor)
MARAALGWGVRDLAARAEVAMQTVTRFEAGEELRDGTIMRIEEAFVGGGLVLVEPDSQGGEGVRFAFKPRKPPKKTKA